MAPGAAGVVDPLPITWRPPAPAPFNRGAGGFKLKLTENVALLKDSLLEHWNRQSERSDLGRGLSKSL